MALTNFPNGISSFGVPVLPGTVPFTGKAYFVNPATGSDGNDGTSPDLPMATIYGAFSRCVSGNNDVIYLIGNGGTSGTARLSLAIAQTVTSTATSGMLAWNKNATHLVGIAAPGISSRARISTPTGTYTAATFGANTLLTVSGTGCYFANISLVSAFSTGNAAEITTIVSGSYNVFDNCAIGFGQSPESIAAATSRALKVTTGGEQLFNNCYIGGDSFIRSTAANSTIELAGGTARPQFNNCLITMKTSYAGSTHIVGTGNNCISTFVQFKNCLFTNAVDQGSTAIDAVGTFSTVSPNGSILLPGSACTGATKWGNAAFLANSYVDNVGGAATAGLMVNPS